MGSFGLFTRADATKKRASRAIGTRDPVEAARRLGPAAVANMNRHAETPDMRPYGDGRSVCLLGLAPTLRDDAEGRPGVVGHAAKVWRWIDDRTEGDCYADHCCRTLPPKGRRPNDVELAAYRATVIEEIESRKPRVIVALGHYVLDWLSPGIDGSILIHRGRIFACKIGDHRCWIVPIYDGATAAKLFKTGDSGKATNNEGASAEEHQKAFRRDLALVLQALKRPPPRIAPQTKKELLEHSDIIFEPFTKKHFKHYDAAFSEYIGFDFESTQLRPYGPKQVGPTTIAVSDGVRSFGVPLWHPEAPKRCRDAAKESLHWIFQLFRGRTVGAHNLTHDLEWGVYHYDRDLILLPDAWVCTEVAAFCIDPRTGKSLDYLCRMLFGLPLKALSPQELWKERYALRLLLEYNVLDAKTHVWVYKLLKKALVSKDRYSMFTDRMRKVPALVLAQLAGLNCSQEVAKKFETDFKQQIKNVEAKIRSMDEAKEFERHARHPFNPASSTDCTIMFRDVLQRDEGRRSNGKYSTDVKVLNELVLIEPIVKPMLEYRALSKKFGTYVQRFLKTAPDSYIYPDGLIHCQLRITGTTTGRLSGDNPNNLNWPKRKGAEARSIIRAKKGWKLVSCDLGQIEARVLAMFSRDKKFCKALWDRYDVHLEQTKILLEIYPNLMKVRGWKDMKTARSHIKNEVVFPAFYGGGINSISERVRVPKPQMHLFLEQFWKTFKGIKRWHEEILEFYNEHFYVDSLIGFRRHGPMNYNRIINTPIQADAAKMCLDGMERMAWKSLEVKEPWMAPILNIYDDLMFHVPDCHVDDLIKEVVPAMILFPEYKFINVPLTCEIAVGDDWAAMKDIATYSSDEL